MLHVKSHTHKQSLDLVFPYPISILSIALTSLGSGRHSWVSVNPLGYVEELLAATVLRESFQTEQSYINIIEKAKIEGCRNVYTVVCYPWKAIHITHFCVACLCLTQMGQMLTLYLLFPFLLTSGQSSILLILKFFLHFQLKNLFLILFLKDYSGSLASHLYPRCISVFHIHSRVMI